MPKVKFQFQAIREEWIIYQLTDGTKFQLKYKLSKLEANINPYSGEIKSIPEHDIFTTVLDADKWLYGKPPNRTYSEEELMSNIEEADLGLNLIQGGKSEYSIKLGNKVGTYEATTAIATIHRSSLKDISGTPKYICYFNYYSSIDF